MTSLPSGASRDESLSRRAVVLRISAAAIVIIVAGAAAMEWFVQRVNSLTSRNEPPAHVRVERNGFRYEFDALTGRARLYELKNPGVDVLPERPDRMPELRMLIESEAGATLEDLQEHFRVSAAALRELGYL
jgi:hypothetical protein